MSYPVKHANDVAQSMHSEIIRNFVDQSKAKQILREVHEHPDNFPNFTSNLDDRVTFLAYRLLAAGCSLIEQGNSGDGYSELQSAADILESAHKTEAIDSQISGFHCLIGAMTFYACGQYSRAFVLIKGVETLTPIAGIIATFLRKDTQQLTSELNTILLAETPEFDDYSQLNEWALTTTLARAISLISEHSYSGKTELLEEAECVLQDTLIISENSSNPTFWWLARLLNLMLYDYKKGSLWNVLPPFFGTNESFFVDNYVRLLAFSSLPITELWQSQISSLQLALNPQNHGGVINLRTSAGKTQVAELAIIQTLSTDPTAKVIYLAPFRSLAFELERTFSKTVPWLGFSISHLYGGTRFSGVDRELVIEANITIATPEKVKAMLRSAPELFEKVKLIVVDEGHLLGKNERDVRNELFLEHLRLLARQRHARILLLSAVLPNAADLASWVGGNPEALIKSDWKPSAERFGLLRWGKGGVQIEWRGDGPCYNPHFVEFQQIIVEGKKNARRFPKTKAEAVAATAARLAELGPVLIFVGQAQWVLSMTRNVLLALGEEPPEHEWPKTEWDILEAVCKEELGEDSLELRAARVGVICHNNKLPPQVRISVEKLIAKYPPRIIVATTTLGQGVNIGISSVIISTTFIGKNIQISKRDFWNICGRAGRAFVDSEGKVLFAIDNTQNAAKVRKNEGIAKSYLNMSNLEKVESGLLIIINRLINVASKSDISFELLLELISNNNFEPFGRNKNSVEESLDLIDDQLLALHVAYKGNDDPDAPVDWVDDAFQQSLALIQELNQIKKGGNPTITRILNARANGVLRKVPTTHARNAVISSGLPLSVGIEVFNQLDIFRAMVDRYLEADDNYDRLGNLVLEFENWARENATSIAENIPEQALLDMIRMQWLQGTSLNAIIETCSANSSKIPSVEICTKLYGYQLPWLFHSIAQQLDKSVEENRIEALSKVGLLVELGLPTEAAAKVFLAGVRSRISAVELSAYVVKASASIKQVRNALLNQDTVNALSTTVSTSTIGWLNMLSAEQLATETIKINCASFQLDVPEEVNTLHVRQIDTGGSLFLCSTDGKFKCATVATDEMPFDKLVNDPRYVFIRDASNIWHQQCRDPRIQSQNP